MDADERRWDALFIAEGSFVVRGRHFVVVGTITEGVLKQGDDIAFTDPDSVLMGRPILAVELVSSVRRRGLVGLAVASDTDSNIDQFKSIQYESMGIGITSS